MLSEYKNMSQLDLSEVFCYICRSILIEPVSLPCGHVFCSVCFNESMTETSYSCPLCRKRISNWLRTAKKENKLVDIRLWNKIRLQYPEEVERKQQGLEDGLDECFGEKYRSASVKISNPGEVAEEFKKQQELFEIEQKRIEEIHLKESEELIKKIQEEEELEIQSQRRRNRSMIAQDEVLARQIQNKSSKLIEEKLNTNFLIEKDETLAKQLQEAESVEDIKLVDVALKKTPKVEKKAHKGPLDQFLMKNHKNGVITRREYRDTTQRCDSNDSINLEMQHFKPIQKMPKTPPKIYPDGKTDDISVKRVTPLKTNNIQIDENDPSCCNTAKKVKLQSKKIHSPYSAFAHQSNRHVPLNEDCKKKLTFESFGILKEISLEENNDSYTANSTKDSIIDFSKTTKQDVNLLKKSESEKPSQTDNMQFDTQDFITCRSDLEEKLIEEQKKIEDIILQEKKDRELALSLSRQWNKTDGIVDRSKNGKRPYELRKSAEKKCIKNTDLKQTSIIDSLKNKRKKSN